MKGARWLLVLTALPLLVAARENFSLLDSLDAVRSGIERAAALAARGELDEARKIVTRVYLDEYEVVEGYYGPGGEFESTLLSPRIAEIEGSFHALLRAADSAEFTRVAASLAKSVRQLRSQSKHAGVPLHPGRSSSAAAVSGRHVALSTPELRPWATELDAAARAIDAGDYPDALRRVERVYLEGFEPLESRIPRDLVTRVERIVHLQLRPALKARSANAAAALGALRVELGSTDAFLARGGSFWFGAVNSLVIILREGLEAVLLIGALLGYLAATGARRRDRVRIWLGVAAGLAATMLTWVIAVTVLPMSGASRELVEGVTALVAVGVLLYVSHWLFQKTYIHDWKEYLRTQLGSALTRGSALAMMGLAFAAVYREGFETVLFYQALAYDVGGRAVLTGFVPGILIITLIGWGIIKAGAKLPLKRMFGITNAVLLYLAFVFLGKGVFNLQESGAFAAHPVGWLPSHPVLNQLFGFYPVLETVLAQAALATLLATVLIVYRATAARREANRRAPAAAMAA